MEKPTTTTETTTPTTSEAAPDFSAPVGAPLPGLAPEAPKPEAEAASSPAATASMLTDLTDLAVGGLYGPPPPDISEAPLYGLTAAEREAFERALVPLCRKYDLDVAGKWEAEIVFGATAGAILLRRIRAKRKALAHGNHAQSRQEEVGKVDTAQAPGVPSPASGVSYRDILARPIG